MSVGMMAIVSPMETPYIGEWTRWHQRLGIGVFHLILNDFTEEQRWEFVNSLPLRDGPVINLHRFDGRGVQCRAYNEVLWNCIMPDPKRPDRLFVLDVDEFVKVRPCPYNSGWRRPLHDILWENPHDIALNWRLYGSDGHERAERDVPVTERFTRCARDLNPHVKMCLDLNDERFRFFTTPHCLNVHARDLSGKEVYGPFNEREPGFMDEIEIAHYAVKSREECRERRTRPRADDGSIRPDWEEFFRQHDMNDVSEEELEHGDA